MPREDFIPKLPHYLEAEKSILGAILLDNPALMKAIEAGLSADDFYSDQNKRIFRSMIRLDQAQKPIDLVMVTEDLHNTGELEASGGPLYVSELIDGRPRISNVPFYANIVKDKSILRNLISTVEVIQNRAQEANQSVAEILDLAESAIFKIAEERIRAGFVGIKDLVRDNFDALERVFTEGKRVTGLPSGYTSLDNLTSGLQPSELIILAARPSMGKSALALNLAENVAVAQNKPVAVFSLEMSKESLLLRLLSSHGRINMHKFRTGHLTKEDWHRIVGSLGILGDAPLWIDDSGANSLLEMSAKARRLKKDKGLSLLVVDYLQLITVHGRFNNRNEEVSSISRGLKALAKELKVPLVVLSQLTRTPEREERRPQLADLRDSGAIEQDADVVMFIHRPNAFKPDLPDEDRAKSELIIAKQRNGPTDKINFVFLSSFTRFEQGPDSWDDEGLA